MQTDGQAVMLYEYKRLTSIVFVQQSQETLGVLSSSQFIKQRDTGIRKPPDAYLPNSCSSLLRPEAGLFVPVDVRYRSTYLRDMTPLGSHLLLELRSIRRGLRRDLK